MATDSDASSRLGEPELLLLVLVAIAVLMAATGFVLVLNAA